jgi:hypothetical protein
MKPDIYIVVTESLGKPVKGPKQKPPFSGSMAPVEEKQYNVLATSVAEAAAIIEESNAHMKDTPHEEVITKAWKWGSITSGMSGARFDTFPKPQPQEKK